MLDVDPYGSPWPTIRAWFESDRPRAETLHVVVNDGFRQKLKINGGWDSEETQRFVTEYGNHGVYDSYLEICQRMIADLSGQVGYEVRDWWGKYCGHSLGMTHYWAVLENRN
ncbi:MAG: hypothetical protein AAFY20_18490 [Cyanobacteria bacterium J06639_14]